MQLLAQDPRELYEVVVDQAERRLQPLRGRPSGATLPLREVATGAGAALDRDVAAFLDEDGLAEIDEQVRERTERLGSDVPFPLAHNASPSLARTCYALCRALRPAVVLETGVAYGVSSSFITKALELNGTGHLHSVDRAPVRPGVESYIGALVPDELRSRWTLHRGTSRRLCRASCLSSTAWRCSSTTASTRTGTSAGSCGPSRLIWCGPPSWWSTTPPVTAHSRTGWRAPARASRP